MFHRLKHTAWLLNLSKSTASRYIITWAYFIYFKLSCVPIWPTKDIVIDTMLECFKGTYPNTRVIIDCTEVFYQKPSSLTNQSSLFSYYKHNITFEVLVGTPSSGAITIIRELYDGSTSDAITIISELYDGSLSDAEIVKRCGILKKNSWVRMMTLWWSYIWWQIDDIQ